MKLPSAYIYGVRGASNGVDQIANVLGASLYDARVRVYDWIEWPEMISDINVHSKEQTLRLAFSYGLGANALTWVLGGVTDSGVHVNGCKCKFDFAVLIDPTKRSTITPLAPDRLSAGLHYKSTLFIVDDIPGLSLEVVPVHGSHPLDKDPLLQRAIVDRFKEICSR
jgi:hypothetical protein